MFNSNLILLHLNQLRRVRNLNIAQSRVLSTAFQLRMQIHIKNDDCCFAP